MTDPQELLQQQAFVGVEAADMRIAALRTRLIEQCISRFRTHDWRLHLEPATPSTVEVYCANCPAGLNDVWVGAIQLLYMQLEEFKIENGTHTARRTVDIPLDVYIKESATFSRDFIGSRAYRPATELEVRVQPKEAVALPMTTESPTHGTGWCAPSP